MLAFVDECPKLACTHKAECARVDLSKQISFCAKAIPACDEKHSLLLPFCVSYSNEHF